MAESIEFLRKEPRLQSGGYQSSCDYVFKVGGQTVAVGITSGWHDTIPSLGRALTDDELCGIAKKFLQETLTGGKMPTPEHNRVEIPHGLMEQFIQSLP